MKYANVNKSTAADQAVKAFFAAYKDGADKKTCFTMAVFEAEYVHRGSVYRIEKLVGGEEIRFYEWNDGSKAAISHVNAAKLA